MLEQYISKIENFIKKLPNVVPALMEAFEKARKEKDKGFVEKISIFWDSFKAELTGLSKEKAKVTKKTSEQVKAGVAATLESVNKKLALKSIDSNKAPDKDLKELSDKVRAIGVNSFETLDEEHQKEASNGLEKIAKAADGATGEQMTVAEATATGGWAVATLQKLKKESGDDPVKLKQTLDKFEKFSQNSKYPLGKLLKVSVLKVFKVSNPLSAYSYLNKIGIGVTDIPEVLDIASLVKKENLSDKDKTKVAQFVHEHLFKHTSESNLKNAIGVINTMLVNKADHLSTENLAKLACYIDDRDYDKLIVLLAGKRIEIVAKAA